MIVPGDGTYEDTLARLLAGKYETWSMRLFRFLLFPGMIALDVGANMGIYTLLAAREVGPGGRVIAVEPDPVALQFLKSNIAANGYSGIVTVVEDAASDGCRSARLYSTAR